MIIIISCIFTGKVNGKCNILNTSNKHLDCLIYLEDLFTPQINQQKMYNACVAQW